MPEDKNLRRARNQFDSPKTQRALRKAILEVPGVTDEDTTRILSQLDERLSEFKQLGKMASFRPVVIDWVRRQAQLSVKLRELLQQSHCFNPTLLFGVLPTYDGEVNVDSLRVWAESAKRREVEAIAEVPEWVPKFRRLVYKAIWSILGSCLDLGVGGFHPVIVYSDGSASILWHPVVEEIAAEVWLWVFENAYDLATSTTPIPVRLWGKARKQAIKWRSERIENLKMFVSQTVLDQQKRAVEKLMNSADRACLSERDSKLLERAESADLDDPYQIDQVFAGIGPACAETILDDDSGWEPGHEEEEEEEGQELLLAA